MRTLHTENLNFAEINISNDIELAKFFLDNAEVAMVPGSAFGAPGCMRISFATSMEDITEGMKRIKNVLKIK